MADREWKEEDKQGLPAFLQLAVACYSDVLQKGKRAISHLVVNATVTFSQISSPHFCCFNSCFSLFYFQLNISTPTKHLAHHLLHVWHTSSSSASKLPCHPLYAFHTAHSVHYFWRNHIHHLLLKSGHAGHLVWICSSWICWHILQ